MKTWVIETDSGLGDYDINTWWIGTDGERSDRPIGMTKKQAIYVNKHVTYLDGFARPMSYSESMYDC